MRSSIRSRSQREYPSGPALGLAHLTQPTAAQLERMKTLGIYAAVHPWAVINGGIKYRQFGCGVTTWHRWRPYSAAGSPGALAATAAGPIRFPFQTLDGL